jgi:hypothetical protein
MTVATLLCSTPGNDASLRGPQARGNPEGLADCIGVLNDYSMTMAVSRPLSS